MNPDIEKLREYPFSRLAKLTAGIDPPADKAPISMAIGEPRHPVPPFILDSLRRNLDGIGRYPATRGTGPLRDAIADWLVRRFRLPSGCLNPQTQVLPVNGTREALFAVAQAVVDRSTEPLVALPNPGYQIYEGAALMAGAEILRLNAVEENDFIPDLEAIAPTTWARCQLLYLCSPNNPTGAILPLETLETALTLAERHDFIVAADECYSEIYLDEAQPPPGLLQAAVSLGNDAFDRCLVFHSLSKRSNVPGLRSGFVAGEAELIAEFLRFRTYHGCAMSPTVQAAGTAAWADEEHVRANRRRYRDKFAATLEALAGTLRLQPPTAGFYLWPETPMNDEAFTRELLAQENVAVVPGSYFSQPSEGIDPGAGRVRLSLVADLDECVEGARRIRGFVEGL